jgi:hypothetical protein
MGEADPSEIVLVDKAKQSGKRLQDIDGVQAALDSIGSVQNITLTRLAKNKRVLFVEGIEDFKRIRRLASRIGLGELSNGIGLTPVESGGFSSWDRIESLAWGIEKTLGKPLMIAAVFDRDFWSDEEVAAITAKLGKQLALVHIHRRKELENYLLVPGVLQRAFMRALDDKRRRSEAPRVEVEPIRDILDRISVPFKASTQAQYIAKRVEFLKNTGMDQSSITRQTIEWFEVKWQCLDSRMEIVPGKEVLRALREEVQRQFRLTLTDVRIIDSFFREEIPGDLVSLLNRLNSFRSG